MKKRTFGNILDIDSTDLSASGTEFYRASDILSYTTLNRAIESIFEDSENSYELLQNIAKTLWGECELDTENGITASIIPDIFEEMSIQGTGGKYNLICDTMPSGKYYVRVPTGAFIAKIPDEYYNYYKYLNEENAQYDRNLFTTGDHNSIIVFNRPNINLFERQVADHFNINLNDEDNKITVKYEIQEDTVNKGNLDKQGIIAYNDERKEIKRNLVYTVEASTTEYSYKTISGGGTAIETEVKTDEYGDSWHNVFDITKELIKKLGNYLMKKDDNFSLEEIIPLNNSLATVKNNKDYTYPDTSDDTYVLFYNLNPDVSESIAKGEDDDGNEINKAIAWYSYSKRFWITSKTNFESTFSKKGIKLYTFGIDYSDSAFTINNIKSTIKKIDRTKLYLKNLNVVNLINNLAIERNNNSYNISNAHLSPDETPNGNINIGDNTLGYPQTSEKKDQDPTYYGQYYKANVGEYNIAIGDNAMRNTNSGVKNNIAIGKNTLINIGSGTNNIEIGTGSAFSSFTDHNINIGDNISEIKSSGFSYNTILGYNNLSKSTSIGDKNLILGTSNIFNSVSKENTIIGINNGALGSTVGNNNYIFGNTNIQYSFKINQTDQTDYAPAIGNNNYIIGQENNISASDTTGNNLFIGGYGNTVVSNSSTIIGRENTLAGNDSAIFGISNKSYADNNLIIGKENTANNTYNNIFGISNSTVSSNNEIFGYNNKLYYTQNIVIGKNNISGTEGKGSNLIVGNGNNASSSDGILIGNDNSTNYDNDNAIAIGKSNQAGKNSIIIGNSYKASTDSNYFVLKPNSTMYSYKDTDGAFEAGYLLRAYDTGKINEDNKDSDWNLVINGYNVLINSYKTKFPNNVEIGGELTVGGSIGFPIDKSKNNYTSASKTADYLTSPVAGSLDTSKWTLSDNSQVSDELTVLSDIKSFIGSTPNYYYWTARQNNGKNSSSFAFLRTTSDPKNSTQIGYYDNSDPDNIINNTYTLIDSSTTSQEKKGGLTLGGAITVNGTIQSTISGKLLARRGIKIYYGNDSSKYIDLLSENERIETNKDIYANSFIATSARDKKKNIVDTTHTNAVEEINKIKIVDFNFKTDENNENPKVGFIADDTDEIFSTKEHNSMDIYNCVGMLLKAVQELSAENKKLQEEINTLK